MWKAYWQMKRTKKKENKSMEDFKIGDEIKIVLKVEENNGCNGCFFDDRCACFNPSNDGVLGRFQCYEGKRSDNKYVIFKLMSCNTDNTKTNLWHEASEEPEYGKKILVQYTNYDLETDYEVDMHSSFTEWKQHAVSYKFMKWCYIEDILPKGGEK